MTKVSLEIHLAGIKITRNSAISLYTQVYEQFREMILTKRLRSGDRIPATRTLAKEMGVSRSIITQSFEQLILEGYLIGKIGSGTYVASVLPDQLMNVDKTPKHRPLSQGQMMVDVKNIFLPQNVADFISKREEVVPFLRGTPSLDFFPYKIWYGVTTKVMKKMKQFHLGYEDTLGYGPLRQEIATYLRVTRGVKCEVEQVVVVTGSQQGLNLVVQCLLKKEDSVWMEDPGYQGARVAFLNAGVKICPVPVESDGVNINYAKANCADARLGFITPSYQYPMGVTLSLPKRLQLLEWAQQKKMWIFEDDYDSEFRYESKPLASLQGLDTGGVVIYTGTFSKVLFPGLRLAYVVLPSTEIVQEFKKVKAVLDRQSPILDQIVLTSFIQEGHFLRHIRKMRLLYAERQQILVKLVKEQLGNYIEMHPAPAGMNLLGWLSPKIDLAKLKEEIKKHQLIVSFLDDYTLTHPTQPAISLGYTAFSKYRLKSGVEKLAICVQKALKT